MKWKSLLKKLTVTALAVTMVLSATACGNDNKNDKKAESTAADSKSKEIVRLKAFTMGAAPASGLDNFYKQLDELTQKDLGCTVRFDYIAWGDEKNKINLAIASGDYDLYVGGSFSDYKTTATKNAFLDLKPLLKDVPELVKHYSVVSSKTLETCEINGKLYGIPQFSKAAPNTGNEGFVYREDLRKQWGLPEINSLAAMEQYMYRAKQDPKYKDAALITDNRFWTSLWFMIAGDKYMAVDNNNLDKYAVAAYDDPYTVVNLLDTPEYKKVLEYAVKWYKDGIVDHDILAASTNTTAKAAELFKADKKPCETNSPRWSIEGSIVAPVYKAHPEWELGWYEYITPNAPAYLPSVTNATAISINANSKNPLVALKFIEKAHTDQKYYDLLRFGVLDENYKIVDGVITTAGIDSKNIKPSWSGLVDGYMEVSAKSSDPRWEAITEKMKKTYPMPKEFSPLDGFSFNSSSLSAEVAAIETVRTQFMVPLQNGLLKDIDGELAKAKDKLKAAGQEKYMAELQKQLKEFAAKKGK